MTPPWRELAPHPLTRSPTQNLAPAESSTAVTTKPYGEPPLPPLRPHCHERGIHGAQTPTDTKMPPVIPMRRHPTSSRLFSMQTLQAVHCNSRIMEVFNYDVSHDMIRKQSEQKIKNCIQNARQHHNGI
mmetsp:Transcript_15581/g.33160  ORF Transcript_15581/g.33160 Transcript_15581/m.33160 type:complete len:129 (-) Transcript_15581:47-433(-)